MIILPQLCHKQTKQLLPFDPNRTDKRFFTGDFMRPKTRTKLMNDQQHRMLLLLICDHGNDVTSGLVVESN